MILALLGCVPPGDSALPAEDSAPPADTAAILPAPAVNPELDLAGVEAAVENATAHGLLWPLELHAWFEGLMDDTQLRKGSCPARNPSKEDPDEWTSYWTGPCEGLHYFIDGDWIAYVIRRRDGASEELEVIELWSLVGTVTATKESMYAGGNAALNWATDGEGSTFDLFYGGRYLDPAWREPLSLGVDGGLRVVGTASEAAGLDATVSGGVEGGGADVQFDDVTITGGVAVSGTVAVRDPSSGWWDLVLGEDGCATVLWAGEARGSTCATQVVGPRFEAGALASMGTPP